MKFLLLNPSFREGTCDWLFLFEHCALKTMNEAVVEGMGSIVDRHAQGQRGLSQDALVMESFIEWNGPKPHLSEHVLKEALDHHFRKKDGSVRINRGIGPGK